MNTHNDLPRIGWALVIGAAALLILSNYPVVRVIEHSQPAQTEQATTSPTTAHPETKSKVPTRERIRVLLATATSSVESLMLTKRTEGTFSFVSRDYPTLGSFLESIDGLKNGNGEYWMLYINGTRSSSGMSQAIVVPGDRIEWRYE